MAQKVLVQLVDDLDGTASPDVTTVHFGLDGVTYDIDLTNANAERLRASVADFVERARRTGGRITKGTKPTAQTDKKRTKAIREWAPANGYPLAERGRIPQHVVQAYDAAMAEEKAPVRKKTDRTQKAEAKPETKPTQRRARGRQP